MHSFAWGDFFETNRLKHLLDALDAGDKGIDILAGVVEGETGAAGSLDAQTVHQWFGTMMAGTNGYAEAVEQSAHIEVVDKRPTPTLP